MEKIDRLICAMGEDDFPAALYNLIDDDLRIRHLVVDGFDIQLRPAGLYNYSRDRSDELRKIRLVYRDAQLFACDPVVQRVRDLNHRHKDKSRHELHLMTHDGISDRMYEKINVPFRLGQRLVILFTFRRRWFAIKLLREKDANQISTRQLEEFLEKYPSLLHIVGWHSMVFSGSLSLRYQESIYRYESLLQNLGTTLSRREIEVCARALTGETNSGVAKQLSISPATVRTLRNRAFSKMGVSRIQELSTLCLSQLDSGN